MLLSFCIYIDKKTATITKEGSYSHCERFAYERIIDKNSS